MQTSVTWSTNLNGLPLCQYALHGKKFKVGNKLVIFLLLWCNTITKIDFIWTCVSRGIWVDHSRVLVVGGWYDGINTWEITSQSINRRQRDWGREEGREKYGEEGRERELRLFLVFKAKSLHLVKSFPQQGHIFQISPNTTNRRLAVTHLSLQGLAPSSHHSYCHHVYFIILNLSL